VKTPEELLREFADNPAGLAEYAAQLQQQLAQARQEQGVASASMRGLKKPRRCAASARFPRDPT
jgi:hypothetical protein